MSCTGTRQLPAQAEWIAAEPAIPWIDTWHDEAHGGVDTLVDRLGFGHDFPIGMFHALSSGL